MDLTASVAGTIDRYGLIPEAKTVLVAVSGGPDSVALLHCLKEFEYTVEAAHLNHQFRGAESDGDADYVAHLCSSLGIPLTSESIDVPGLMSERHVSAQEAARSARYTFFERTRLKRNLDLIATAHNLDDRVETVILNIIRGSGVDGLRGIPYRRGDIVRPLLDTPRSSVEGYVKQHGLSPRTDSTNALPKYARNAVRHELLPTLERQFNPGVRANILRLSQVAADESDYLNALAEYWIARRVKLPVDEILAEPIAFQRRILRSWIKLHVHSELSNVSHILVEQLRLNLSRKSAVTIPGGRVVVESNGKLVAIRDLSVWARAEIEVQPIVVGSSVLFGDYVVTVTSLGEGVDIESLHVRQWQDGDRISLAAGSRKVKDVFTDSKLPRALRRRFPLIADKDGIVSIGDIRNAARAEGAVVLIVRAD